MKINIKKEDKEALVNSYKKSYRRSSNSCGFGCISYLVWLFLIIAWFWGLSTPWGRFEIDIFPPKITIPQGEIKSAE